MKFGSIRAVGQVIATGSISSATTTILTGSSQLTNLGYAITGSNTFTGTQTMAGSIIPSTNNTYDLGSPTYQFRHVYISSGSLYVNGTKVLGSTAQELQITTDVGQSFKILEAGSDTITLQSADGNITLTSSGGGDVILDPNTGVIALKGTTTVYSGNKIVSSDGNAIQFGNGIAITGSIVATGTSLVSGSSQITFSGLSGIPSGLVSGSSQTIANLPSGTVSGSAQVTTYGFATTGSNTFQGAQTINGSLNVVGNLTAQQYIVSSSVTYLTESFASGSHKFGDSSDDNHNFTGSVIVTGSLFVTGGVTTVNTITAGNGFVVTGYPAASGNGMFIAYNSAGTNTGSIYSYNYNTSTYNPTVIDGSNVYLYNSGVSKLAVVGGYVGINKTVPNAQLDVNGNALVSGSFTTAGASTFNGDLSIVTAGTTTLLVDGTNPTITLRRNNNGNASSAINFKGSTAIKWQIGTNQATGLGFEINEGDATANRFYIAPGGAITTTGTINGLSIPNDLFAQQFLLMGA
jgi:hypothetical protein